MNNILLKLLCSSSILFYVSFPANAGINTDSTKLIAANSSSANSLSGTTIIQANVVYPAVLNAHIDESLNYVQNFSNKKKNYLASIYQKGKNLFPKVEQVLRSYNLPQELKMLIALESGFNANARSHAGAVGYWQFMDDAALEYGLQIGTGKAPGKRKGKRKDDRTNFLKSTVAAAKYLRDRAHDLNNDLLLIVASYNWGIGNIWKAMKKTGLSNPGFWDIKKYLPAETKAYVMNFIALNVLFQNYDKLMKNQLVFNTETLVLPVSENIGKLNTAITD